MEIINQNKDVVDNLKNLFLHKFDKEVINSKFQNYLEIHEYIIKNIKSIKEIINYIAINRIKNIFEEIELEDIDYKKLFADFFIIKISLIFILLSNKYSKEKLIETLEFLYSLIKNKSNINENAKNNEILRNIISILFVVDLLTTSIFSKNYYSILENKEIFKDVQSLYKNSDNIEFKNKLIHTIITIDIVTKIIYLLIKIFELNLDRKALIKLNERILIELTEYNSIKHLFINILRQLNLEEIMNKIDVDEKVKTTITENIFLFCFLIIEKFKNSDLILKIFDKKFKN